MVETLSLARMTTGAAPARHDGAVEPPDFGGTASRRTGE